ncbi:hypothetical protein CDL15_Pgr002516 [Punica granatum]|uniref:F-box domain-containing protein n=1 Tax=Punica granatum TaxID=22663 RepID=A0A218XVX9_PUNGR|nr:hypothetical protein CDL15_Pgr002516 [Punica granatum]
MSGTPKGDTLTHPSPILQSRGKIQACDMDPNPGSSSRPRRDDTGDAVPRDRFLDLPDSLLLLIISFLPFKDAVKMMAVSRLWCNLCRSARNVEFKEYFFTGPPDERRIAFTTFMRRWIEACPESSLDSVELALANPNEFSWDVDNCISFALGCRVKHLGLNFSDLGLAEEEDIDIDNQAHGSVIDLPSRFYNHTGLGSIRLFSCRFQAPKFRNFVALKSVALGYMELEFSTISTLLENCPALETFSLERCWNTQEEYARGKHLSLQNLIVDRCDFLHSWFGVDVPNLRLFKYSGMMALFEVDVGQTIQEAELDFSLETEFEGNGDLLYMLISSLAGVKRLTVCSYTLQVIPSGNQPLSMECPLHVTHLILKTSVHSCDFWGISFFLKSCPLLEMLTIEITPLRIVPDYESPFPLDPHKFWAPRKRAFQCFKTLEVIEVKGFKGTATEIYLLKHAMRHGRVMRSLNLHISNEDDAESTALVQRAVDDLMASPRVSPMLQIGVIVS